MSNQRALAALEILELAGNAQALRSQNDPFFLTITLSNLLQSRRSTLAAVIGAASLAEGDRAGASAICRACLETLEKGHRAGKNFIDGLLPDFVPVAVAGDPPHLSDAMRLMLHERYGFEGGVIGEFDDARKEALARQAPIAAGVTVDNPAWVYPQPLLDFIAGHYATLQAHQSLATGGTRQQAVAATLAATEAAEDMIARVRGFYISASDAGDRTPELKRIGLQPRRLPGEASSGTVPDAPANAVLDTVAKTLTIATMPANANSLRCYRQKVAVAPAPAGPVELCGVSVSTTVSYTQSGPLDAGVGYEVWVVGYDGTDEGSPGNRIAVTG